MGIVQGNVAAGEIDAARGVCRQTIAFSCCFFCRSCIGEDLAGHSGENACAREGQFACAWESCGEVRSVENATLEGYVTAFINGDCIKSQIVAAQCQISAIGSRNGAVDFSVLGCNISSVSGECACEDEGTRCVDRRACHREGCALERAVGLDGTGAVDGRVVSQGQGSAGGEIDGTAVHGNAACRDVCAYVVIADVKEVAAIGQGDVAFDVDIAGDVRRVRSLPMEALPVTASKAAPFRLTLFWKSAVPVTLTVHASL